ncbi:Ig-like domain-containing protein [Providencia alcalifaciens]
MQSRRSRLTPRQAFDLTLKLTADNAAADGQAVNTVTAELKDGNEWAAGESVLFTVTGHAQFTDSHSPTTTAVVSSQGVASVNFTDTTQETVTVIATVLSDTTVSKQVAATFGSGAVSLPPPELNEAAEGHIIPGDVAGTDVHVFIAPSAGLTAGSTLTLIWVGTDSLGSTGLPYIRTHTVTEGEVTGGVTLSVDADAYVMPYGGGVLRLSYTVNGGTSAETLITVDEAAVTDLLPPGVDEAEGGRIPEDTPTLTLRIPPWTGMAAGDRLAYSWKATNVAGSESLLTDSFPLIASDVGHDVTFDLNPTLAVVPFDEGKAEAWYTVTPAAGSTPVESAHARWPVGGLSGPVVEEADGEDIDISALDDTFTVNLRWSDITVNDQVSLYWQGTFADGTVDTQQVAGSHRVTEKDVTAGKVVLSLSTETFLAPYEGGSVAMFYTLNRADGRRGTTQSETRVYWLGPVTVFEDFEGNDYQTIQPGASLSLNTSGSLLKNTGNQVMYISSAVSTPPLNGWSLVIYAGENAAELSFPGRFRHIRFGRYYTSGTVIFYDEAGEEIDTTTFSNQIGWVEYTLKRGLARRIKIIASAVNSNYGYFDNITVSLTPIED